MSDGSGRSSGQRRYLAPRFPDGPFCMDNADNGFPIGLFSGGHDFLPFSDNDGSVICQPPAERPVILRVIKQKGNVIHTLDGTGAEFRYRMTPIEAPTGVPRRR